MARHRGDTQVAQLQAKIDLKKLLAALLVDLCNIEVPLSTIDISEAFPSNKFQNATRYIDRTVIDSTGLMSFTNQIHYAQRFLEPTCS